jgi:TRAP-type C4-dicarboxylate transport system permease small subunit
VSEMITDPYEGYPLPRWIRVVARALAIFAGAAIAALAVLAVSDVVMRKLGNRGIPGVLELTEIVLVVAVFAALMSSELNWAQVRTPILTERLGLRAAETLRIIGRVCAIILLVVAVWVTTLGAIESVRVGEYRFGLIQVPIWPARVAIPIGLAGLALAIAVHVAFAIRRLRSARPAVALTEGRDA